MLELFKGLDILDPKFYIPVIVGVIVLFIIIKVAKSLFKFALFIAVVALVALVFFNVPTFKVNGDTATLSIKGQEYTVNVKDVKIKAEEVEGKQKLYLVSNGEKVVELPFSREFAQKFILDKVTKALNSAVEGAATEPSGSTEAELTVTTPVKAE
ncbi:MAG: hypothetical protein HGA22_10340 [Clostridiales bacterium]|nr:hypothetical protein [Clostridiales bacterium]